MFNLSPEKIMLLGILALVVLGPTRLPQAARTLAKVLTEVRKVSGSFQSEVRGALAEPHDALNKAVGDLGIPNLRSTVRSSVAEVVSPFNDTLHPATPGPQPSTPASGEAAPSSAASPAAPDDPSLN